MTSAAVHPSADGDDSGDHGTTARLKGPATIGAAIAIALVVAVGLLGAPRSDDVPPRTSEAGESPSPATAAGWAQVDDWPLSPRTAMVTVWTGHELLVVGGAVPLCRPSRECTGPAERIRSDGAALDPMTGRWREIARSPIAMWGGTSSVVIGDDAWFLVRSQTGGKDRLLRYSVPDDSWDEEKGAPLGTGAYTLEIVDDRLVAIGINEDAERPPFLVRDPISRAWSPLPDDVLPDVSARSVLELDGFLYVLGQESPPSEQEAPPTLIERFDPASEKWERLPDGPAFLLGRWLASDGALVHPPFTTSEGDDEGAIFDIGAQRWRPFPPVPSGRPLAGVQGTAGTLLSRGSGPVFDVAERRWIRLPRPPDAAALRQFGRTIPAAGDDLVIVGGYRWRDERPEFRTDIWVWRFPS